MIYLLKMIKSVNGHHATLPLKISKMHLKAQATHLQRIHEDQTYISFMYEDTRNNSNTIVGSTRSTFYIFLSWTIVSTLIYISNCIDGKMTPHTD